ALGPLCCVQAFSSCGESGLLFIAACGLLIAVASLVPQCDFLKNLFSFKKYYNFETIQKLPIMSSSS
ncbi:hypothetical protein, partial [Streptococcus pneumoniae]